jgi:predicted Zn-dependent protease
LVGLPDSKAHAVFEEAQAQYLQGNWFEAEALLLDLLDKFPKDAEALLLLIGVLRHTQRWQPALRRLDQLQSLDTAAGWHFEIIRERQIVEKRFREAILEPQTAD